MDVVLWDRASSRRAATCSSWRLAGRHIASTYYALGDLVRKRRFLFSEAVKVGATREIERDKCRCVVILLLVIWWKNKSERNKL